MCARLGFALFVLAFSASAADYIHVAGRGGTIISSSSLGRLRLYPLGVIKKPEMKPFVNVQIRDEAKPEGREVKFRTLDIDHTASTSITRTPTPDGLVVRVIGAVGTQIFWNSSFGYRGSVDLEFVDGTSLGKPDRYVARFYDYTPGRQPRPGEVTPPAVPTIAGIITEGDVWMVAPCGAVSLNMAGPLAVNGRRKLHVTVPGLPWSPVELRLRVTAYTGNARFVDSRSWNTVVSKSMSLELEGIAAGDINLEAVGCDEVLQRHTIRVVNNSCHDVSPDGNAGRQQVPLSSRPECLVEFGGREVRVRNLWPKGVDRSSHPAALRKTAPLVCDPGTAGFDLNTLLSDDSAKGDLIVWSTNPEGRVTSRGRLNSPCPNGIGEIATFTVEAHHKDSPALNDTLTVILISQASSQEFATWLRTASGDTAWLAALPCTHASLGPRNSDPEPGAPEQWNAPVSSAVLVPWPSNYHPAATYEMRSIGIAGAGHQATYDRSGKLIEESNCPLDKPEGAACISAGTADRVHPGVTSAGEHQRQDVDPFIIAAQLDGNPVEATALHRNVSGTWVHVGESLESYFKYRPVLPTGKCAATNAN